MALNKIKRILASGLAATMMMSISGCTTSSENKSTAEYIKAGEGIVISAGIGYETAEVSQGSFVKTYQTDAYVTYTNSQRLYWENSQDRYDEILVSVGDIVKKGDVLATFEGSSSSEADALERTLAVEEAQAALNRTVKNYDSSIAAKKKSMETLTGYDYEIASLELQKLESEYALRVKESEYQITKQQEALNELLEEQATKELIAPFDGRIDSVNRDFQKGNKVNVGSPIVQISDLDSQVFAFRNNTFSADVSYLSEVTLTDRVTGEEYTGTIVSCPNVTNQPYSDVIVELDTELPEGREDVYFKVDGYIMQKENVTLVDNRALKSEGSNYYVYILNENNARYKTYVTIGETTDGLTWVIDGLTPGQTVLMQ